MQFNQKNSKGWEESSHQFDYLLKCVMGTAVYPLPQPRSQFLCALEKRVGEGPRNEIAHCHRSYWIRKINLWVGWSWTNTARSSPKEGIWITILLEFLMRGQLSLNSYKCKKINCNYIFQKSTTFQIVKLERKMYLCSYFKSFKL